MFLGQYLEALQPSLKEFKISTENEDGRAVAVRIVCSAVKAIYLMHPWEVRRKTSEIVQIPNYTAGTCGTTKFNGTNESAARTVTFSTALPSGLDGRYFQVEGESDWHRILYTSGSTAYLESPVLINQASTAFRIWKRFYFLPSNVSTILEVGKWDSNGKLAYHDPQGLTDVVSNVSDSGSPTDFTPFGNDDFAVPYTMGTVQVTANSNILIGTGTAWIGNVFSGDIVIINSIYYRVKRVDHDTRIVLHNYVKEGIAAATTYTAKEEISTGIQLYGNENNYRVIPYMFLDKHFDLIHETLDRPNLPEAFDDAILSRAEMMILKNNDNPRWASVSQLFANQLEELKSKYRVVIPRYKQFAPNLRNMPGRG